MSARRILETAGALLTIAALGAALGFAFLKALDYELDRAAPTTTVTTPEETETP